ncbi:MAG: transcriptional regulator NrdR [Lentisphaerae bacterium GWF2_44_16]|nr:MAG: transcriptional regulator NrdR [Lentisphaerae bacterium GWF2_44_16]
MRCPRCTCLDDKVVDSRTTKEGAGVRRRRECLNCGHRFTTYEEIIQAELKVVKSDDIREDFDREKLRRGIEKACWKRSINPQDIDNLVDKIVESVQNDYEREIPSREVGARVMRALKELDEVAYVRFASVYRQFKDIDQFIEEIRSLGNGNAKS